MLASRLWCWPLVCGADLWSVVLVCVSQVDILLMIQPQSGRWVHFDTELTNSSGRVAYTIPKSKKLSLGVYPVKMVVK